MPVSSKRIKEIFTAKRDLGVAVVGDFMVDVYIHGTSTRLAQEAPIPVVLETSIEYKPGGAGNVVENCKSVYPGIRIYEIGVGGKDCAVYKNSSLDVDSSRPTTTKTRVFADGRIVCRHDRESTEPLSVEMRNKLSKKLMRLIRNRKIQAIIIQDHAKGVVGTWLQPCLHLAKKNGIYTALDPNPKNTTVLYNLDLLKPNREEMNHYINRNQLRNLPKSELILATKGADGMVLAKGNLQVIHILSTRAKEVFDVTGAGDTVISLFVMAKICGADDIEAMEIANIGAGIAVGKHGTASCTVKELMNAAEQGEQK